MYFFHSILSMVAPDGRELEDENVYLWNGDVVVHPTVVAVVASVGTWCSSSGYM